MEGNGCRRPGQREHHADHPAGRWRGPHHGDPLNQNRGSPPQANEARAPPSQRAPPPRPPSTLLRMQPNPPFRVITASCHTRVPHHILRGPGSPPNTITASHNSSIITGIIKPANSAFRSRSPCRRLLINIDTVNRINSAPKTIRGSFVLISQSPLTCALSGETQMATTNGLDIAPPKHLIELLSNL